MRAFFLSGLLIVGLVVAGSVWYANQRGEGDLIDVSRIPQASVDRGTLEVSLESIGELRAAKSSVLGAPFEGKIIQILEEGTRVQEDDPVIWFETVDIEEELEEEEAQLALDRKNLEAAKEAYELEKIKNEYTLESERTKVESARQAFEDAKQKYEAEQVLYERNISPETKLNEARLKLLQAELDLRNAQINLAKVEENLTSNLRVKERDIEKEQLKVDRAEREVEEERRDLESAVVRATSPGDISYLKIWKSGNIAKVAEGDQVWRRSNLVEIPDTSEMLAIVPINEIDISEVEEGQEAQVELIALPGRKFPATVAGKSIVPISDPSSRSWDRSGEDKPGPREFEVRVRLNESNDLFRQGMTASARIVIERYEDVLLVPVESILEREGESGVWVLKNGGNPEFKPVKVIATNEFSAAIEDGPVTTGNKVLLAPPSEEALDTIEPAAAQAIEPAGDETPPDPGAPS